MYKVYKRFELSTFIMLAKIILLYRSDKSVLIENRSLIKFI